MEGAVERLKADGASRTTCASGCPGSSRTPKSCSNAWRGRSKTLAGAAAGARPDRAAVGHQGGR
eukprot:1843922-Alexandrium_andersonii.AAC.1